MTISQADNGQGRIKKSGQAVVKKSKRSGREAEAQAKARQNLRGLENREKGYCQVTETRLEQGLERLA